MKNLRRTFLLAALLALASGCALLAPATSPNANRFSIAVIPDTQNYVDYKHQKSEGFAIDSADLFIQQMRDIASRATSNGGDVVFAASVGDVWQHQTLDIDPAHAARGFTAINNPFFASEIEVTEQTKTFEMPKAAEGYRILAEAGVPFGVAPGNHDYDAMWSVAGYPPNLGKDPRQLTMTAEDLGMLHIGGLDNFRSVFGRSGEFFRDQPWYVASFNGGANSAQLFEGGGYTFLHIALEMQPQNAILAWAERTMDKYRGLPTIITTHDYLDTHGQRRANPIVDLARADPAYHNSAEDMWNKLIRRYDQIFMVLCGHHHGQSLRIDENAAGHPVYQILADYQDRGQTALDAGQPVKQPFRRPHGVGDGWYRLMTFDFDTKPPKIRVRTYSSHYERTAKQLDTYASWYKDREHPDLSDREFVATDHFELVLDGFTERFPSPR